MLALSEPGRAQQFSAWSAPLSLGPGVNSAHNDQHPAISRDQLTLYFVTDRPGGAGGTDIWVSRRSTAEAPWGAPVPLPSPINTPSTEFAPTLAGGGHLLVFGSNRSGGCGEQDLWVSRRADETDDFGWEAPVNLGCVVNGAGSDDGPTWYEHGEPDGPITLYFTSLDRGGGLGDYDVWASTRNADGTFTPPVDVVELNSSDRDTRTTIRGDGLEIVFTSNRPGSVSGSFDLWSAARRSTEAPWSAPVNVGPPVNSPFNDGAPALSSDAETLYFYSSRPGGSGANDLFVARRTRVAPGAGAGGRGQRSGSPG